MPAGSTRLPLAWIIVVCAAMLIGIPYAAASPEGDGTGVRVSDTFRHWWAYENALPEDADVDADAAYQSGLSACDRASRGVGEDEIVREVSGTTGLTHTGAGGLYRAALESLCPQHNRGYMSYFDRQVDLFRRVANRRVLYWDIDGPAPIQEYGWFMRAVNAAHRLGLSGPDVVPYLHEQRVALANDYGLGDDVLTKMADRVALYW